MNFKARFRGLVTRRKFLLTATAAGVGAFSQVILYRKKATAQATLPLINDPRFSAPVLDPVRIPKFADPLPTPGAGWPVIDAGSQNIRIVEQQVNILPQSTGLPTTVWCYRGSTDYNSTFLGPTMVAQSRTPNNVTYDYTSLSSNTLHLLRRGTNPAQSVVDKQLHGTDMGEPEVRFIAHLHGAKGVDPGSDGYAEAWITPSGQRGPSGPFPKTAGGTATHTYPNDQGASLIWYHDHALGITRLNVYAGGAGGYIITDATEASYINAGRLPQLGGPFDIPLVIQDRMFYADGRLAYPDLDANTAQLVDTAGCTAWPAGAVSNRPEYFGDAILVNGKTWPFLEVDPAIYRFRFLNGCNSRVLDLSFSPSLNFQIIGTEGGFLPSGSVRQNNLTIAGAERFDVLVDFRGLAGRTLTLTNRGAKKPFPKGTPPNPQSDGLVMQVRVRATPQSPPQVTATPPARWNPGSVPTPQQAVLTRRVLLYESRDIYGRIQPLLGTIAPRTGPATGSFQATALFWEDPITETPQAGTIEIWEIFNCTADAHPIHIHETLFSVWQRQAITFDKKASAPACPPGATPTFAIGLQGQPKVGEAYEQGFKDTALTYPGEVTRLIVDFRNAMAGRFVWHCHILEHEDHEMMRPYDVIAAPASSTVTPQSTPYDFDQPGNIVPPDWRRP